MNLIWGTIGLLLVIVWVITIYDIFRRRLGTGPTVAWLVAVLVLPFLGALLYWALRKPTPEEVDRAVSGEAEIRRARERSDSWGNP
jgi:hypothetical protein